MTATESRHRRYLKQTRSTLAVAEFFREHAQFTDCEFTFTGRSVTIFAKEPNADLAEICEIGGFALVVDELDPAPRYGGPSTAPRTPTPLTGRWRPSARLTGEDQRPLP
jgi:hypothetical protein